MELEISRKRRACFEAQKEVQAGRGPGRKWGVGGGRVEEEALG